jgi:TP901 family phage tail tape measure protein
MASNYEHLINIIFAAKGAETTKGKIKGVFDELDKGDKPTRRTVQQMGDFEKALRRVAIVVPIWMAFRLILQSVFGLIREQTKFIVDMENAMARIQIVGKGTKEELKSLQSGLVALSYAYGISAAEALDAAKTFAQQGRTVQQTFSLTRIAMIGAKVLGTDMKTIIDDLTAAIEGFNIPVTNAVSIVDKWINVEKEFAVTSKDLADATKVAGASAHQLGMSISEFLGDVTAVIEVTRKSGNEAARGLSFIYARLLTSAKPVIEQIAKIPFYLDAQGKATSAVTSQTRSLSDILGDLNSKWDKLTTLEKLQIATSLGSKRQMTVLNALMQNYNRSLDARVVSLTSAGQAEKAFAIIQDTVTYKSQQLTAAWNNLTFAVADTSSFKSLLDVLGQVINSWTLVLNFEKGYRIILAQQNAQTLANIESRKSELESLQELITVRDKLAKAPPTDENIGRLKIIQTAIDKISSSYPKIKVAVEEGDLNKVQEQVTQVTDRLEMQKIVTTIGVEFQPKIESLQEQKKQIEKDLEFFAKSTPITFLTSAKSIDLKSKMSDLDGQIAELEKKQTEEIQKQYSLVKAQTLQKQINVDLDGTEEEISITLSDKEKEQLEIEKNISIIKSKNSDDLVFQVQKEIELVKNSKFIYDAHAKTLKLEQLQNDLINARLQKRDLERQKLIDIAAQYEKADMFEKSRIRRLTELQLKTPEELKVAFETSAYDKNLIIDYWDSFKTNAQEAIGTTLTLFKDLKNQLPYLEITQAITGKGTSGRGLPLTPAEVPIIPNITNVGAQNVQVNVNVPSQDPDEIANLVSEKVKDSLLTDDDFQTVFGRKLSPKI